MSNMDKAYFASAWEGIPRGFGYHAYENGVGCYTLNNLAELDFVAHGFSARTGGVSTGPLSSLNLSFSRVESEPRAQTMENYRIFCAAVGIDTRTMVMDNYEHGVNVLEVDRAHCGMGWTRPPLPNCDGLVTNDPAVTLITGHADCMAFYFVDPVKRAIGLAHAGWRGALNRMGCRMVEMLQTSFDSRPSDILCGVGPSICQDHFEVDAELGETFSTAFPYADCVVPGKPGKAQVDLWKVAVGQFLEAGILPEHIQLSGVCTYEDQRLYSYRRDKPVTGGMAAYLRLVG